MEANIWAAYALKAAETAMEKAMVEIIKQKGVAADDKLVAIKMALVHQHRISLAYEQLMENA